MYDKQDKNILVRSIKTEDRERMLKELSNVFSEHSVKN